VPGNLKLDIPYRPLASLKSCFSSNSSSNTYWFCSFDIPSFYSKYQNVNQNVRHIKKNTKKHPKQLDITSDHIQSSSSSHKPIGLSSTARGHLILVEDRYNMSFRSSSAWNDCTPAHSNHFF